MIARPPSGQQSYQAGIHRRRGRLRPRRTVYRPMTPTVPAKSQLVPVRPPGSPGVPAPPPAATTPGPPPRTSVSAGNLVDATTARDASINASNQGIVQAALQLGDPATLAALKRDPQYAALLASYTGGNLAGSIWDQLARGETQGLEGVDSGANDAGTFFSGFRLKDRGDLRDQFSGQRSSAVSDYQKALTDYEGARGQALSDFEGAQREADQYDIEAALQNEPPEVGLGSSGGKGKGGPSKGKGKGKNKPRKKVKMATYRPEKKARKKSTLKALGGS